MCTSRDSFPQHLSLRVNTARVSWYTPTIPAPQSLRVEETECLDTDLAWLSRADLNC